jgi:hypothetical protein
MNPALSRLACEPPFRILARALLKRLPVSLDTRVMFELSARPSYLLGLAEAVNQAKRQGVGRISAIEFGVAGGNGLVILQNEARAIAKETGVAIDVYGFDATALPAGTGDFRDHPDLWQPGDFQMDVAALKARLFSTTTLLLGEVADTMAKFKAMNPAPLGFISFDLDYYSSTADAMRVFDLVPMLRNVPLYFDDIEFAENHRWGGEFLAIEEFNDAHPAKKIDRWYGVRKSKAFPERVYFEKMYVAHDLEAITAIRTQRAASQLKLRA